MSWSIAAYGVDVSCKSATGIFPYLQCSEFFNSLAAAEHVYKDFQKSPSLYWVVLQSKCDNPGFQISMTVFHLHDILACQWDSSEVRNACYTSLTTRIQFPESTVEGTNTQKLSSDLYIQPHTPAQVHICVWQAGRQARMNACMHAHTPRIKVTRM